MNRAARRKAGIKERTHRISLEEWRADPDKFITRADAMALMQLHEELERGDVAAPRILQVIVCRSGHAQIQCRDRDQSSREAVRIAPPGKPSAPCTLRRCWKSIVPTMLTIVNSRGSAAMIANPTGSSFSIAMKISTFD